MLSPPPPPLTPYLHAPHCLTVPPPPLRVPLVISLFPLSRSRSRSRRDTDGDGEISLEEFKVGVAVHPQLVEMFLAPAGPGSILASAAGGGGGEGKAE